MDGVSVDTEGLTLCMVVISKGALHVLQGGGIIGLVVTVGGVPGENTS